MRQYRFHAVHAADKNDRGARPEQQKPHAQVARPKEDTRPDDVKPATETGNDMDYQAGGGP